MLQTVKTTGKFITLLAGVGLGYAVGATTVFEDSFEFIDVSENLPIYPITGLSLVSASSLNATSAQVDWLAGESTGTTAKEMRYGLHFSTNADFIPTMATLKKAVTGKTTTTLSATADGLTANTEYYVIITATDKNDKTVRSKRLRVKTADTTVVRTANTVYELPKSQTGGSQTVANATITVPNTS